MIPIFDMHVHPDARTCNDYEAFALGGVEAILVPCSATRERRYDRRSYAERFRALTDFERARATSFGLEYRVALAVNAADVGDYRVACEAVEEVEEHLAARSADALGEIVFRTFSPEEVDLFERQLRVAERRGVPVLVEAPPHEEGFRRFLSLLESALDRGVVSAGRVCLLDLNREKLRAVYRWELGGYGIPVSPPFEGPFVLREKLTPGAVRELLDEFGPAGIMLNSGLHVGYADPLCLPRSVLRLKLDGVDPATLRAIAFDNARAFFGHHAH